MVHLNQRFSKSI